MSVPPKLVNHRLQLPSLESMLDEMIRRWPDGQHPDFSAADGYDRLRAAFFQFGLSLLSRLELELTKAAGKGIAAALELIQDPDYYETGKKRKKRDRERLKEWRERDEKRNREMKAEQGRRDRGDLTEEERIYALGHLAYQIHYHQKELDKLTEQKRLIETKQPFKEKPQVSFIDRDGGDDEWPDRISFD